MYVFVVVNGPPLQFVMITVSAFIPALTGIHNSVVSLITFVSLIVSRFGKLLKIATVVSLIPVIGSVITKHNVSKLYPTVSLLVIVIHPTVGPAVYTLPLLFACPQFTISTVPTVMPCSNGTHTTVVVPTIFVSRIVSTFGVFDIIPTTVSVTFLTVSVITIQIVSKL